MSLKIESSKGELGVLTPSIGAVSTTCGVMFGPIHRDLFAIESGMSESGDVRACDREAGEVLA